MTDVTVQYDRKLSDGNYGSEGLSMSWTVTYDDSDNDLAADQAVVSSRCQVIGSAIREAVLSFLSKSEARNVAYAAQRELNLPPPRTAEPAPPTESLEDLPY
jgi:curli biogenesis system outer membrane secretion channel CsgG